MSLPPLLSSSRSGVCTCGDVVLQQGVALAPGVVLVADPGSSLVIETGVCIGTEVVLHATGGELRIEAGTILGAGVLVVGKGKIGPRATVGTCATLLEPTVAEGSVIAPGEIVGDFGEPQTAALAPAAAKVVSDGSPPPMPLAAGPPIQDSLGPIAYVITPLTPLTLPVGGVSVDSPPPVPLAAGPPIQDSPGPIAHVVTPPQESPEPEEQVVTPPEDSPGPLAHVVTELAHFDGAEGTVITVEKIVGSFSSPPPAPLALAAGEVVGDVLPPFVPLAPAAAKVVSVGSPPPVPLASGPPIQGSPGPTAPAVTPPQDSPEPEEQVVTPPEDSPGPMAHVVTGLAHFARLKALLMGNNGK